MLMKWSSTPTDLRHATGSVQHSTQHQHRVSLRVFVTCCVVELFPSFADQTTATFRRLESPEQPQNPNYRVVLGVKAPLRDNV